MPFVNTVDIIGDEALAASIIDRSITEISDGIVTYARSYAFYKCTILVSARFYAIQTIGYDVFQGCSALTALILCNETVCVLSSTSALTNTPIASGTGYIYVPAALVDSYKAATNWSTFASQFRALESYTVDGTTTGELDPTKI